MSNIVQKSLSKIWIIYAIVGSFLVLLSTIFSIKEEIFTYVAILYGILGIILLIINKYNKPIKIVSFEQEFKDDLKKLEHLENSINDIVIDPTQLTRLNDINNNAKTQINSLPVEAEIAENQSFNTSNCEAFSTSANNGLFI